MGHVRWPTEVEKRELGTLFQNRFTVHHMVSRGGERSVGKGALAPISIIVEKRQGRKLITKVHGLETFLIDPEAFGRELQTAAAASASVGEREGKGKGLEVTVQGGEYQKVATLLINKYGVPKKYVVVDNKVGGKR